MQTIVSQLLDRRQTRIHEFLVQIVIDELLVDDGVDLVLDSLPGDKLVQHQVQAPDYDGQFVLYLVVSLHHSLKQVVRVRSETVGHEVVSYSVEYASYLFPDFGGDVQIGVDCYHSF